MSSRVYAQEAPDEVKSWASATPPGKPVTCVDFVSASPASTVLVLVPRALGPSARKATLHESVRALKPRPAATEARRAPELDDKAATGEDSQKCEWATFRLTLAREFCDAERYEAGDARPQALPALLLPPEVVSLIIRTFAVTTYDSELTCLFRVRKKDADAVHSCARALPSGAFLAPQRSQTYTVTWLKRPANQSSAQYLQLAKDSLSGQCPVLFGLPPRGPGKPRHSRARRCREGPGCAGCGCNRPALGFDWGAHCLGSCRSLLLVD